MTFEGAVRREDLRLRSRHIEIDTTIYKINHSKYLIYIGDFRKDFEKFKNEFLQYKIMGVPVQVTNIIPAIYEQIIPSITDKEIAKNFEGLMFNQMDLLSLLIGKFPKVFFTNIEETRGKVIIKTCEFTEVVGDTNHLRFLNNQTRDQILQFGRDLKLPFDLEIVEEKVKAPPVIEKATIEAPISYTYSKGYKKSGSFEFTDRDEALWFDNIEKIYSGEFKKSDLYFFDEKEYSCYVDYTYFDNIDIRNHLFLYQTIYITLPGDRKIREWLKSKKIEPDEFLELIKRNRVKIIINQRELTQDVGFFLEIYKANPNAIISRRAVSALQQIDIVEISDNYIFNGKEEIKELTALSEIISKSTGTSAKTVYEMLAWPIKARRSSFNGVRSSDLIALPGYGVNTVIQDHISNSMKKDRSLEFMITAPSVHLAGALNATYFPYTSPDGFTDYYYANLMGVLLNFYKSATEAHLVSFVDSRSEIESGILPINPIEIINVNNFISIIELDEAISESVSFDRNKKLIEYLAKLSPEDRKAKISHYNKEIKAKFGSREKRSPAIDLATNIFMDYIGKLSGFEFLGTAFSGLKITGQGLSKKVPQLKYISEKLAKTFSVGKNIDKQNIHYLAKINRVARVINT